jgi:hypothetical protein
MPSKTKDGLDRPRASSTLVTSGGTGIPTLTPEQTTTSTTETTGLGAPALQPPGIEGSTEAQAAAAGITATSATVGGLWTNNAQSNAWVYLNAVGWRRLSPANPGAHHAMLQIARLARDANIQVQCEEDGSVVHAIYVW